MNVNAIQQRARDARQIALDLQRRARAFLGGIGRDILLAIDLHQQLVHFLGAGSLVELGGLPRRLRLRRAVRHENYDYETKED